MKLENIGRLALIASLGLLLFATTGCFGSGFKKSAANVIDTCDNSGVKKVEVNYKQEVIRAECKEGNTGFWITQ